MTMAVIREPKSRVLSAYLDKILLHSNPQSKFSRRVLPSIQKAFGLRNDQRPSFEQFLQWNQSQTDIRQWNPHWRPMVHLLGSTNHLKLWTMKQINSAIQVANKKFDCDLTFPQKDALGPRPTNNSQLRLDQFYGHQEKRLVEEMYAADITLHAALEA